MFEDLEKLNPLAPILLRCLHPLAEEALNEIHQVSDGVPSDYLSFLRERGFGVMRENESAFALLVVNQHPLDAANDYFGDDLVYSDGPYEEGARGTVWLFGTDSTGTAFGFDSGDRWRLMEIDSARNITRLDLTFQQFIEGMFVCYPQRPVSYSFGVWRDSGGGEYSVSAES